MTTQTEIAVKRFITSARELFVTEPDPDTRWQKMGPVLEQLLADPDFLMNSKDWPYCIPTDRPENLIFYEDPDYGFCINGLIKQPNRPAVIHDHAHIYTLYGVLDGTETIERYERTDDGSNADYALVRQTDELRVKPGDMDLVAPWQIHTELNNSERSVAVIIRSEHQADSLQGKYEPVTNRYFQGYGPRYTPYKLF